MQDQNLLNDTILLLARANNVLSLLTCTWTLVLMLAEFGSVRLNKNVM